MISSIKTISFAIGRFLFQAVLFSFLLSCLTQIEIPVEKHGGTLVISGQISTLEDRNVIQLGLTANTERLPFPVEGATVYLYDDLGNTHLYSEDLSAPGTYRLHDVVGIPGRTYYIQVFTLSGNTYESQPEKMPEAVGTDSTFYEVVHETYTDLEGTVSQNFFLKIYSTSNIPSTLQPLYLKWSVEEVYKISPTDFPDPFNSIPLPCYVIQSADPQRIVLFNSDDYNTHQVPNQLVCSRVIDRTFYERHYFNTYQSSLTKEAFEYWNKVNILANQVGSIFDTPPAEINGNIFNPQDADEKVLGYFQATNQSLNRFFLLPPDLPFTLTLKNCLYDPARSINDYPRECLNCLSARNSGHARPEWF